MPHPTQRQRRAERPVSLAVILTLASWRLRATWFLLLFITLGMVAAVVIALTIPLFSQVMETAGLRSSLRATPTSAEISLNTSTQKASTPIVQAVHEQFDHLLHRYLGNAIQVEQSDLLVQDFTFPAPAHNEIATVFGTSLQSAGAHLDLTQGRLARVTSASAGEIEVMMTSASAKRLGLRVGSTFNLDLYYVAGASPPAQQLVRMRLVGLLQVTPANSAYWHGNDFNPVSQVNEATTTVTQYTLLAPDSALLALFDHLSSTHQADGIFSPSLGYTQLWYYHFDPSRITINNLDAFITRFADVGSTTDSLYGDLESSSGVGDASLQFPYLSQVNLSSPLISSGNSTSILELFRTRIAVAQIPVGVFALLSIALILFFVSLMTAVLVDQQSNTIALLRSRGASQGQIFGALFLQSSCLGLITLVLGLPIALLVVIGMSQRVLPTSQLDALDIVTRAPLAAMLGTIWYALAVVVCTLLTMGISLFLAARLDVLSLRREAARSSTTPFWQRLKLDLIAGVVALVGYGVSLYVTSVGNVLSSDAQVLLATPLSVIAPFFLILACLLLFLRIFPLLLRLGARLSARGRGAVSLLAFAQIARAPRQAARLTMLLALAITFTLFTLVFNATEVRHIQEIVAFETGADFSAGFVANTQTLTQPHVQNRFQSIPGVISASVGRNDLGYGGTASLLTDVREVDAASFARSVNWSSPQAYEQARPLFGRLLSLRQAAISEDYVPAIVDQATLTKLLLHVGSAFTIQLNSESPVAMHCVIVGVLEHIPTINDRFVTANGGFSPEGGVLVDYQTNARIFMQDARHSRTWQGPIEPPVINQLWLHTQDDARALASVRIALNNPQYSVIQVEDRRLLLATLQSDPLNMVLLGVLGLGTAAVLLLTLIGDLLTSWLSAYTRLTSFALLRALGITTRQVANMLTWEQAIVYAVGVLLGGGFGTLLATSVIPSLTFTNLNSNLSNEQFFALQSALSTQIVVPPSLPLVLLVLVAMYGIALTIMVRVTTRTALDQALRLNED